MDNLTQKIKNTKWEEFIGPDYYNEKDVTKSLLLLYSLNHEKDIDITYNKILFTIGNNHEGTYYPVILEALKFIIYPITTRISELSMNCALNILIDLYSCFSPKLGTYSKKTKKEIENFVKENIDKLENELILIENSQIESNRNKLLVKDLLELIKEAKPKA